MCKKETETVGQSRKQEPLSGATEVRREITKNLSPNPPLSPRPSPPPPLLTRCQEELQTRAHATTFRKLQVYPLRSGLADLTVLHEGCLCRGVRPCRVRQSTSCERAHLSISGVLGTCCCVVFTLVLLGFFILATLPVDPQTSIKKTRLEGIRVPMTTFPETSADETSFPLTATSLTLCLPCYLSVRGTKLWRKHKKWAQIEQKS